MEILQEKTKNTLMRAREIYGYSNQILVAMEELNELAAVLAKYGRYSEHDKALHALKDKVIDEVADVLNVIDHIQAIFDISDENLVLRCEQKAQRLERWLSNSNDLEYTTVDRAVNNSTKQV